MKTAPKGNVQVGDTIWTRHGKTWLRDWKVVKVGILNHHNYPLDFTAERFPVPDRSVRQTFSLLLAGVLIFPHTLPAALQEVLQTLPRTVRAVRRVCNSDEERFSFIHTRCGAELLVQTTEVSYGDLRWFPPDRFSTGKEEVAESGQRIVCGCKRPRMNIDVNTLSLHEDF